jgi:hypothetical protein
MEMDDAVVGRRYLVEWDDCCAAGRFEAVLAVKHYVPDLPGGPYLDGLTFDNGVTVRGHGVVLTDLGAGAA